MDPRLLAVFFGALIGGVVQALTGFGCGVLLMIFMPLLYPLLQASAITSALCIALTVSLAFRFRKSIQFKKLLLPGSIYLVMCNLAIYVSTSIHMKYLVLAFGLSLIILSVYFLVGKNRLAIHATPGTAVVVSTISGLSSGFFGIGGPLMAPYFLSASESKEEYIGMMQALFTLSTVTGLIARILRGIYTIDLLPATLCGAVGVIIGRRAGLKVLNKINIGMMSKLIYVMMGLSGLLTILTNLS